MSLYLGPRIDAVYDMERMDFIRERRVPLPSPPTVVFEGGPLAGVDAGTVYAVNPDYFETSGGRYLPTLRNDGVYVWCPDHADTF